MSMKKSLVDKEIAINNANILQSNISRMNENSGRLKALFLPFLGIVISMEFATAFGVGQSTPWFNEMINRAVFGIVISTIMFASAILFIFLDYKYLKMERQLRSLYNKYCVNIVLHNNDEKDVVFDDNVNKLVDISSELNAQEYSRRPGWSIILYYPVVPIITTVSYFLIVFIIK